MPKHRPRLGETQVQARACLIVNLQEFAAMVLSWDHGIASRTSVSAIFQSGIERPATTFSAGTRKLSASRNILAALTLLLANGLSTVSYAQNVSCTCRYQGEDYGIGESICLKSGSGMKIATCSMVLNNTSWKFSNAPCPLSQLEQSTPVDSGQLLEDADEKEEWRKTAMFNAGLH